jgi:hypothetical protein
MALTYVSDGAWGTGQGAPLNASQHDTNVFTLAEGIAALETSFDEGVTLVDPYVTTAGNIFTFYLSNDTTVNVAIDLPTFTYRGTWLPSTAYALNDIVTVAGTGAFMVLVAHLSDTTFDPEAVEEVTDGELLYGVLLPEPDLTDVVHFIGSFPVESQINQYDIFVDSSYGLFISNAPHVSDATFDPAALDDDDAALYTKLAGPPFAPVEEIADTEYDVTWVDTGKYLRFTDDVGIDITFDDSVAVNTEVHLEQAGDGPLTFIEDTSSVTILPQRDGFDTSTPYKGAVITAKYVAAGIVKLIGPHGVEITA